MDPTINTPFPDSFLGQQLLQVAKIIKLNQTSPLNLNRQIFYVTQGGYDTHQDQATDQGEQLRRAVRALGAFYAALVELGVQDNVAAFTLRTSDGRWSPRATPDRSAPTTAGAAISS